MFGILLTGALLISGSPAPAHAAVAPGEVSMTLYDLAAGRTPTLVVRGELAPDTTLPATVELSIPSGCEVGWVGEVFPEDSSKDVVAPFDIRSVDGADVLVISVISSRVVQAELIPPQSWIENNGMTRTVSLTWTAPPALSALSLGFEAPDGYIATVEPADAATLPTSGGTLYRIGPLEVPDGETVTLSGTLTIPDVPPSEEAPSGEASTQPVPSASDDDSIAWVPWVGGALAVALLGMLLLARRQRTQPPR